MAFLYCFGRRHSKRAVSPRDVRVKEDPVASLEEEKKPTDTPAGENNPEKGTDEKESDEEEPLSVKNGANETTVEEKLLEEESLRVERESKRVLALIRAAQAMQRTGRPLPPLPKEDPPVDDSNI